MGSHSIASSRLSERGLCVPQPALTLGWGYSQTRSCGADSRGQGFGEAWVVESPTR